MLLIQMIEEKKQVAAASKRFLIETKNRLSKCHLGLVQVFQIVLFESFDQDYKHIKMLIPQCITA